MVIGDRLKITITVLALLLLVLLPAFSFSDDAEHHDDSGYSSEANRSEGEEHYEAAGFFERTFTRGRGEPSTETVKFEINDPAGIYKVLITNGEANGSSRCSSAVVNLNGTVIVNPSDLNKNVASLVRYVNLGRTNTLRVTLNSAPGSFLKITVFKKRVSDTTPPVLTVSTLATGSWTNVAELNISGKATDNIAMNQLTVNSTAVTLAADGSFSYQVLMTDGPNIITVTATDLAGNVTSDRRTINLDRAAPGITLITPADGLMTNQSPLLLNGSVNEQTDVAVILNNAAPAAVSVIENTFSTSLIPAYGLNTIEVIATDRAGNKSSAKRTVIFDDRSPLLAVTNPPSDLMTNQADLILSGTVEDFTTAAVTINIDGNIFTPVVINNKFELSLTFTTEKEYQIIVRAFDEAGNESTMQRNVVYDITAADVMLDPVTNPTTINSQILTGTVEAGAIVSVSCPTALVGSVTYLSPVTWTAAVSEMAEGPNEVTVVAVDQAGNAGNPVTVQLILDTTLPSVKISSPSDGAYVNSSSVDVSGAITDATTTVVTINGSSADVSGGSFNLASIALIEGPNTLRATATDAAGNTSHDEITVISDTIAPLIVLDPVLEFSSGRSIAISGRVEDQTASVVTLQGKSVSIPAGGGLFSIVVDLTEGQNILNISVTDSAGNTNSTERSITLDTIVPAVRINQPVSGTYTNSGSVAVSGSIIDATSVRVAINGINAIVSDSGFTLPSLMLSEGSNTITATCTDAAGNTGSDTVEVVLDTISPVITIDPTPVNTNQGSIALSGRVDDQTASVVTVQGKSVSIPAGGGLFSIVVDLTEGQNILNVSATDSAGNASGATRTVTLDSVAPIVKITLPASGAYIGAHNVSVSGTVSDSSSLSVTVNGTEAAVTGNSFTLQSLALSEGANTIKVEATDAAGNRGTDEISVVSDTIPPVITVTAPADGLKTGSKMQTIAGSVSDASAIVSALLNDAPLILASNTFAQQITLQEGAQTITVRAADRAGNIGTAAVTVTLDDIAPAPPVFDTLAEATNQTNITVAGVSEPFAKIKTNSVQVAECDPSGRFSFVLSLTPDTMNYFSVTATDDIGNESGPAIVSIMQDSITPTVTGFSLMADPKDTLLIPLELTFSEPLDPATVNASTLQLIGPAGLVAGTYNLSGSRVIFTPSADLAANQNFTVTAATGIRDIAGNSLAQAFSAGFDTIRGPSFIMGEVYDDTLGLPLENIEARIIKINETLLDPVISSATDSSGRFVLQYRGTSGNALIEISALGYTKSVRAVSLRPNTSVTLFDARLTPAVSHNIASGSAADIMLEENRLTFPASAFAGDTELKVAQLSQQGLGSRLPLGWSPIFGLEISAALLNDKGQLAIKNLWSERSDIRAAFLDEKTASWQAVDFSVSADFITIDITRSGQYVLLLPDVSPVSPPLPQAAGELIRPSVETAPDGGSATVQVLPPAVISSDAARAKTGILVTTLNALPSGTVVEAAITESNRLTGGEVISMEQFIEDITLYAWPPTGNTNTLGASFTVSPSQHYPLGQLSYGRVGIDISWPDINGQTGTVLGDAGGTAATSTGVSIIIPPLSLSGDTVFTVSDLPEPPTSGNGVTYLGGLMLIMEGGGFKPDAFPQFVLPNLTAPESSRLIAAKVEPINGITSLHAVATATVINGKIVITGCLSTGGVTPPLQNCLTTGRYAFYLPSSSYGFITGTVLRSGLPLSGAVLSSDTMLFKAVTDSSGGFLLPALTGSFVVTAEEKGASVSASGTLAPDETKTVSLIMKSGIEVISVSPFDRETGIALDSRITVNFSASIDPETVTAATFVVSEPVFPSGRRAIPGRLMLSSQNRTVVFVPDAGLKSDTYYYLKLTSGIKDTSGNLLNPFESVFSTSTVLGNNALAPGLLKVSMPDTDGYVTVRGGSGLTAAGTAVVIINDTKNIVLTVIAEPDGSFTGRISAELSDELIVQVSDPYGNITALSPGLFQNDDGTAAVGPKGGTIYGPGGIKAMVPEGAYDELVTIRVSMLPEDAMQNVRRDPEMTTVGAFRLETGGIDAKQEIKITIPAPDWITPDHQILIGRVINFRGIDELTLACPAVLKDEGGERSRTIASTSPPFQGVLTGGDYAMQTWSGVNKGVGYQMIRVYSPVDSTFVLGSGSFVFPNFNASNHFSLQIMTYPITVPVDEPFTVNLTGLEGQTLNSVSIQGPPQRGMFTANPIDLYYDPIPPTVFDNSIRSGSTGVLLADNIVIEMSEPVNFETVDCDPGCGNVVVRDSSGNAVEGTVYLAYDRKTIVFVPTYGYEYATDYTIEINGVKDLVGNAIEPYTSNFRTFEPEALSTVKTITNAAAVDRYKGKDGRDYLLTLGTYKKDGEIIENSGLIILDVTDPKSPVIKGAVHTGGNDHDVKALPNFSFIDRDGKPVTGDFAVVVGGEASTFGYLDLIDVTNPKAPYIYSGVYLSWSTVYTDAAPPNVPYVAAMPLSVAVIGSMAYVANVSLGIQAVDLTKVTPPQNLAQQEAIASTLIDPVDYPPSFRQITRLKQLLLATSINKLSIIEPFPDDMPPQVEAFSIPEASVRARVCITTFSATDNLGGLSYLLTESSEQPSPMKAGWSAKPWSSYKFKTSGTKTLYAWAKDGADNVSSAVKKATVKVTLTDPSEIECPELPVWTNTAEVAGTLSMDNVLSQVTDLQGPMFVTGVETYPLDIDDDGNLGTSEDEDGDIARSENETFDLAFVSTRQGVVIFKLNDPRKPEKLAVIPLTCGGAPGLPGRVVVNRAKRLAYTSFGDTLYAISLKSFKALQGNGLKDTDGDCMDDRIVSSLEKETYTDENGNTVTINYAFSSGVVEMDSLGRELLYQVSTTGEVQVVDLNEPHPEFKIVAYDDPAQKMNGVVTDGTALLKLQINANGLDKIYKNFSLIIADEEVPLRQTSHTGKLLDDKGRETLILPLTFNASGFTEVVYRAPDTFVRWGTKQESNDKNRKDRKISVKLRADKKLISLDDIKIKRPPVVLVHGLWGCGKSEGCDKAAYTWKDFEEKFNKQRLYDITSVDYYKTNADNFASNAKYVKERGIDPARKAMKDRGFAAFKVDIIGHSMGGLITREYCRTNQAACSTNIKKFITIDTPHLGSEMADLISLVAKKNPGTFCYSLLKEIEDGGQVIWRDEAAGLLKGALIDLAVGSGALNQLAGAPLQFSAITGTALRGQWYDPSLRELWIGIKLHCFFGLNDYFLIDNDLIISTRNQSVSGMKTYNVLGVDHLSVLREQRTVDKVKEWLDNP